jgi:hypothetical protein
VKGQKEEKIKVEISVLKVIYNATLPIYYRLYSLLGDFFEKKIKLSETDAAVLLDFSSCAVTLKVLIEEFLNSAESTEDGKKLILSQQEFLTIMSLSKTVELSTRSEFGNITIQEH